VMAAARGGAPAETISGLVQGFAQWHSEEPQVRETTPDRTASR